MPTLRRSCSTRPITGTPPCCVAASSASTSKCSSRHAAAIAAAASLGDLAGSRLRRGECRFHVEQSLQPSLRRCHRGDGPRSTRKAKGSASDRQEDGLIVTLETDVEAVVPGGLRRSDEEVATFGRNRPERGVAVVGRLVGEVDARDDAVEKTTGEHRHRQVRRLRGAVDRGDRRWLAGVQLVAALGVGGTAGEQPVGLPRLDEGVGDRCAGAVGDGAMDVDGVGDDRRRRRSAAPDRRGRCGGTARRSVTASAASGSAIVVLLERRAVGSAQHDVEAEPERPLRHRRVVVVAAR